MRPSTSYNTNTLGGRAKIEPRKDNNIGLSDVEQLEMMVHFRFNIIIMKSFYGASSMERLPTEIAITEQMRKFKAIRFT